MFEMLLYIFLLSVCASFVQRVSGFGFGIFIMMFLSYIMPSYYQAVALSGILSGTTALFIVVRNFRHICWRKIPVVLLSNVIVSYFVVRYMENMSGEVLRRLLGAVLVAVALYFIFFENRMNLSFRSLWSRCAVGAVSGVMGAMFAMPGPAVVMYGVSAIREKKQYVVTMQTFWLLFNLFYMLFRSGYGYYSSSTPLYWSVGALGVVVGLAIGALCFNSMSNTAVRKVVYAVMLASGIAVLLK